MIFCGFSEENVPVSDLLGRKAGTVSFKPSCNQKRVVATLIRHCRTLAFFCKESLMVSSDSAKKGQTLRLKCTLLHDILLES